MHFEEAQDFSDTGSLITQAPQPQSIHATINALSSWVSAIQPRESWYLAALVWLKNLKNIQGMLARWLAKLQQFHFEIIHRPGARHGNADGLSRCPQCDRGACAPNINSDPSDPEQPYASSCIGSSLDSELIPLESGETCMAAVMITQSDNSKLITAAQMTDSDITIVRNWFIAGKFPARTQDFAPASHDLKSYWVGRKSLFLDDRNILWRNRSETSSRAQLVVPRSLRDTIFNDSHHTTYGGHFGITHTHSKLQLHYFWPGMSDFVSDRISACHKCVARKSPTLNHHHPMGHVPVSGKFERVAMNLLDVSVISQPISDLNTGFRACKPRSQIVLGRKKKPILGRQKYPMEESVGN